MILCLLGLNNMLLSKLRHYLLQNAPSSVLEYYYLFRMTQKYNKGILSNLRVVAKNTVPLRTLSLLPIEPKIIVDVGAHKGDWVEPYTKILGNKTQFYLIEPFNTLYDLLCKRYNKYSNIHVYNYALSSSIGLKEFHISASSDFSSLEELNLKALVDFPKFQVNYESSILVNTESLASFHDKYLDKQSIDILKMDIQGHEYSVLNASTAILQSINSILIEWNIINFYQPEANFVHIHNFLTTHGFILSGIPNQARLNSRLLYVDAFYLNEKLLDN